MLPPLALSSGRAAAHMRMVPLRLISTTLANSTGSCSTPPRRTMPAQLTSTSSADRLPTQASMAAWFRTSSTVNAIPCSVVGAACSVDLASAGAGGDNARPAVAEGLGNAGPDAARAAGHQHRLFLHVKFHE